jgi:Xaa-Pro aminopeptidase
LQNLLAIREEPTANRFGGTSFLGFERLTFCPIQSSLLELSLMSESEIEWLNEYHHQVWEKVQFLSFFFPFF